MSEGMNGDRPKRPTYSALRVQLEEERAWSAMLYWDRQAAEERAEGLADMIAGLGKLLSAAHRLMNASKPNRFDDDVPF